MSYFGISAASRRRALSLFAGALLSVWCAFSVSNASAQAKNPRVVMVIEPVGEITVELYPQKAPKTVAHFLDLVNKKFYDGILFHRYAPGFVVQAGDPKSKTVDLKKAKIVTNPLGTMIDGLGEGGSGKTVPLEAELSHERGTFGMARSQERDSGDSQFFINLQDNVRLDGDYCVFGRVVAGKDSKGKVSNGLDIMDKIRHTNRIKSARVLKSAKKK